MSATPEPFKKGGGFSTKQGVCRHSGHGFAWPVDGSVAWWWWWWCSNYVVGGPGGTIGRFIPLEVSDK